MFKQLAFAVVVAFAVGLFTHTMLRMVAIVRLRRADDLKESWGQRIASLMAFFFGQGKVVEEKRSWHHLPIYWGFLVLTIATVDMGLSGLLGEWFNLGVIVGPSAYAAIKATVDWANLVVLAALMYAFTRRFIRPAFVPLSLDAMLILGAITMLVLSHFFMHAFEIAAAGAYIPGAPVSSRFGALLGLYSSGPASALTVHVDPHTAHVSVEVFWWVHMSIVRK